MHVDAPGGTLRRTLVKLADMNVDFVVCGGVACILQGVARATHDLDVRVDLTDANLRRLIEAAQALDFVPRIPEPIASLADPERRRDIEDLLERLEVDRG